MDVVNELLDAIEIIVDKKIRENTARIYPGICKSINGNTCVMSVNGKNNTVQFYGSTPTVGSIYRVFVPDGNMSMAFAITGNDNRKGLHYSNPNLLDNWYFGNPVNQRGQTEYAVSGYNIDRWKSGSASDVVKVENGVLSISMTALYQTFSQSIENPERYSGETLTVSVLVDSVDANDAYQLVVRTGTQPGQYATKLVTGSGLFSTKWKVPDGCTLLQVVIQSVKENAGNISIKATKLELGSQQTLAHQDTNGNWVLNEIPDYGEQLRRCQRYFMRIGVPDAQKNGAIGFANCANTTLANTCINTPVTMRAIPSATLKNIVLRKGITDFNVTGCNIFAITGNGIYMNFVSSGLTVGDTLLIRTATGGYIDFTADL